MITIITVGKIKEKYFSEAIKEYQKRLSKYTKLELIELPDYDGDKTTVLRKEGELILKSIPSKSYVITMEIDGEIIDSETLSKKIDTMLIKYPSITFIIGGSYGLANDVKDKSDYKLSFSKLTFPHQLFRVILLEQIYRSFKIIKNEAYHK